MDLGLLMMDIVDEEVLLTLVDGFTSWDGISGAWLLFFMVVDPEFASTSLQGTASSTMEG